MRLLNILFLLIVLHVLSIDAIIYGLTIDLIPEKSYVVIGNLFLFLHCTLSVLLIPVFIAIRKVTPNESR